MRFFSLFYNLFLLLWGITILPKLIKRTFLSKEKGEVLRQKLGLIPLRFSFGERPVIWFHCVSLGETKAAAPLIQKFKDKYPNAAIVCSHSTSTGLQESQKNPLVEHSFILPLDLSFITSRLVKKLNPSIFILVETDFWPHLIRSLKKTNATVILVNGKISERSYKRFRLLKRLGKHLFTSFDLLLTQNLGYEKKFVSLGASQMKTLATGNLKFDISSKQLSMQQINDLKQRLFIKRGQKVLTFSCTHEGEEDLALEAYSHLKKQVPHLKLIIAPRHPHRFDFVHKKIACRFPVSTYSNPEDTEVLLIDQLGVMGSIYLCSHICVLGGSFVEGIGGHNLFEPLGAKTVLVYGPYVDAQEEMDRLIQKAGAAIKVSKEHLTETLASLVEDDNYASIITGSSQHLIDSVQGATEHTFEKIEKLIEEKNQKMLK